MFGFSLNPVDWVTSAAGAIVGGVTDGVFDALTGWVEKGLTWFAQQIATLVTDFGNADLSDGAYAAVRSMLLYVAIAVVIGTIMLATAGAALSKRIDLDDVVREIPVTLAMIAGWGAVCSLWFGLCQQLTVWALSDTLHNGFSAGLSLDAGIASFFRFLVAALMTVALIFFALEMLFIGFLGPFAAAIGPVSLALRPWPHLRDVAKRMVMNLVLLSLTPFLTAAAMSLAMRNTNSAGVLGLGQALKGVCGMLVAVLMPSALKKFLPLDGQGGGVGRAMLAAAAATTAAVAGMVATGGASAAAGAGQLAAMAGGPPGGMPPGGTFAPTGSSDGGGPALSPSAGPSPAAPSGGSAGSSGGGSGGSSTSPTPATAGGGESSAGEGDSARSAAPGAAPGGAPTGGQVPSTGAQVTVPDREGSTVGGVRRPLSDHAAGMLLAARAVEVLGRPNE